MASSVAGRVQSESGIARTVSNCSASDVRPGTCVDSPH